MVKKRAVKLSPGEMEVLSMLWQHGELTLAEAHNAIGRPIGYTTIQTRLNRLVDKGFVHRSDLRPCKYSAGVTQAAVTANHLNVLVDRVAQGHVVPLVAQLIEDRDLTQEEISDLKRLIQQAEKRNAR